MFGLSSREVLIKAIKNACQNHLSEYRRGVEVLLEMPEEEQEHYALEIRRNYLNAVCDSMWNSFGVSSPVVDQRFRLVMMSPSISGIPSQFSVDYLCTNGISAGIVFAFSYYALTNKTATTPKLTRDMSALNHYQVACMNSILDEYDK